MRRRIVDMYMYTLWLYKAFTVCDFDALSDIHTGVLGDILSLSLAKVLVKCEI